jgi:myo-inositol-1(or 4)-monophosphatase
MGGEALYGKKGKIKVTTENDFSEELETAERAAREAGAIIMGYFGKDYVIEQKSKNNPVTTADLEANKKIQEILLGRYPDDGWLSEESKDDLNRLKTPRVWVIDPIDGTKEFIEKIPQFAVSIGLVVAGRTTVGVVYNPAQEKFYKAAKGLGATLNGRPIHVSTRAKVEGASLVVSRSEPRKRFQPFAELCNVQPVGSIAFRLALVAGGEGDGMLTFRALHEWDVCGGVAIVEEAGGIVIDGQGNDVVFNRQDSLCRGLVASNPTLGRTLHGMLVKSLAENF